MVKETDYLLNYLATYPNTTVHFQASNMILYIHSDTVCMVLPIFPNKVTTNDATDAPINGAIHNECSTVNNVMGLAVESEVGGLYVNCQQGEEFCIALQEMGHPQLPTI
eukprot:6969848-Ditylum_brightwellii.AAC.1